MFVVIPFCHKDEWLALKNLEWAKKLDGRTPHTAMVVHDDTINGDQVRHAAEQFFEKVVMFCYPRFPGRDTSWPIVQNHQFQEAATYISYNGPREPWLWWEPDAVPLRSGWITAIEEAHNEGGKPYAGHIVTGDPFRNGHQISWMTGVGVYPHNVPSHSGAAMSCMRHPWDVASWKDVPKKCTPINHLIQHIWEIDGGPPSFSNAAEAEATLLPTAVMFHRCKDGSLINALRRRTLAERISDIKNAVINLVSPDREDAQSIVTAVITTHKRLHGLKASLDSCLKAGIKHIIIAASGVDNETRKALSTFSGYKEVVKAMEFPESESSGTIWAKALAEVRTEMCGILHDDD
jgi:hypothetical protein